MLPKLFDLEQDPGIELIHIVLELLELGSRMGELLPNGIRINCSVGGGLRDKEGE